MITFLLLGPSNSARKMPCHVPHGIFPSVIGIVTELPIIAVFM